MTVMVRVELRGGGVIESVTIEGDDQKEVTEAVKKIQSGLREQWHTKTEDWHDTGEDSTWGGVKCRKL